MPTAYSYVRFSSPQQAEGDSLRRQTAARDAWLAAHPSVTLDTSLRMSDLGRSGFKRDSLATYALGAFVDAIKTGRVEAGSYLLVENLDRLSRENAGEATELFLSIVNKGVTIVQLSPVAIEFRKPVDMISLMLAVVELSRGHSESKIKSERHLATWHRKQREAATKLVTKRLPCWVRYADGKLELDPEKAEVVRRMYGLAIDGMGAATIARVLTAEGVPPLGRQTMKGRAVGWSNQLVRRILASPAAIGSYVPHRDSSRAGDPVPGYFPAVVSEETYYAAQTATRLRAKVGRGRRGKHVNLFAGLLVDARDGGPLTYRHQKGERSKLIPVNAATGKVGWASFGAAVLERVVLERLNEITAAEVMAGGAVDPTAALTGRLAELDAITATWVRRMDDIAIAVVVAAKLADLRTERAAVAAKLAEAQRAAASPLSAAWGELRTLAAVLATDNSDETRLKVRAALRRTIERVEVLVVPLPGLRRGAGVAVRFAGGALRDRLYVILDAPAGVKCVTALAEEQLPALGSPEGRQMVEEALAILA